MAKIQVWDSDSQLPLYLCCPENLPVLVAVNQLIPVGSWPTGQRCQGLLVFLDVFGADV